VATAAPVIDAQADQVPRLWPTLLHVAVAKNPVLMRISQFSRIGCSQQGAVNPRGILFGFYSRVSHVTVMNSL
jgi:hypothetical protein